MRVRPRSRSPPSRGVASRGAAASVEEGVRASPGTRGGTNQGVHARAAPARRLGVQGHGDRKRLSSTLPRLADACPGGTAHTVASSTSWVSRKPGFGRVVGARAGDADVRAPVGDAIGTMTSARPVAVR
jgi:hypothetical protein